MSLLDGKLPRFTGTKQQDGSSAPVDQSVSIITPEISTKPVKTSTRVVKRPAKKAARKPVLKRKPAGSTTGEKSNTGMRNRNTAVAPRLSDASGSEGSGVSRVIPHKHVRDGPEMDTDTDFRAFLEIMKKSGEEAQKANSNRVSQKALCIILRLVGILQDMERPEEPANDKFDQLCKIGLDSIRDITDMLRAPGEAQPIGNVSK